jgi:predicted nuclease with TOPRIM domain
MTTDFEACPVGTLAELERLRAENEAMRARGAASDIEIAELHDRISDIRDDASKTRQALRERLAELERHRVHAGVDLCEVAAAVEVVRAMDIVKDVTGLVERFHEGPFRHGFETACEEIEHRLRPCERCGDSPKAGA